MDFVQWLILGILSSAKLLVIEAASVSVVSTIPRSDITCWTCPLHLSNEACNKWAPNLACPQHETICQTFHLFNSSTGETLSVEKSCVRPALCTSQHVGCEKSADGRMRCTSCCKTSLCNEDVPVDRATAINLSSIYSSYCRMGHNLGLIVILLLFSLHVTAIR